MFLDIIKQKTYSDVEYVEGIFNGNPKMERAMFKHCWDYFGDYYKRVFFVGDDMKDEIFQESFLQLWNNIKNKKIYVENGILKGNKGEPFKGKLTTYFMSIAILKYKEVVRKNPFELEINEFAGSDECNIFMDEKDEKAIMLECIEECLSNMSERCYQILSKFYYEMKSLDEILKELTTFISKDALKTAKYKCMEKLSKCSKDLLQTKLVNI